MFTILEDMKTALASVPGVQTCKIGIETGISPDDYPIIRIVPQRSEHGSSLTRTKLSVMIYFGAPLAESDAGGLEAVYESLCTMEEDIITALENSSNAFTAVWKDTVTDEDRLEQYKLFASRFDVVA